MKTDLDEAINILEQNDFFKIEFRNNLSTNLNWCSVVGSELYNNKFRAETALKKFRANHINNNFDFRLVKIKMSKYVLKS
jgi:aspartokinase